jgi:hypothetical protein
MVVGCISSAIDRKSAKYRDMFQRNTTREMFRAKLGNPVQSWEMGSTNKPAYLDEAAHAYDVFAVRGKIAKPGDGSAQATVNAVSLGSSEVICIPITIVSAMNASNQQHTLVVYYDSTNHYERHELYDKNGHEENVSGY